MEGFRYYDLMRWKEGQCMAQSFKGFYLPATAINKAYDIDGDGTNDVCFYTTSSHVPGGFPESPLYYLL